MPWEGLEVVGHHSHKEIMKVRLIQNYKSYLKGNVINVPKEKAEELVKKQIARVDRMFAEGRTK